MSSFKVILDIPPNALRPNVRAHWRVKRVAVKEYREHAKEEAEIAAYEQRELSSTMPWSTVGLQITYYNKTARAIDPDNILATLKPAFDGLVRAGILTDDKRVTYFPPIQRRDPLMPRVELEVLQETDDG